MKYPKWFWSLIIAFVVLEFLAIPILGMYGQNPSIPVYGIVYTGLIGYPIFVVLTLLLLNVFSSLNSKKLFSSMTFLAIPIIVYFPF